MKPADPGNLPFQAISGMMLTSQFKMVEQPSTQKSVFLLWLWATFLGFLISFYTDDEKHHPSTQTHRHPTAGKADKNGKPLGLDGILRAINHSF